MQAQMPSRLDTVCNCQELPESCRVRHESLQRHLSFLAVDSFDKMLHSGQFIGIDARRRKRQGLRIGLPVLVDACELN